jgi:tetratricopeptide (TPR) repeat protein
MVLAQIDARLGRKDEAIAEAQRAVELLPAAKDAADAPAMLSRLASVYAHVGETSRALDLLAELAKMPWGPSYGALKLDEMWDPLRREPRFEKILASLAPLAEK